MALRHALERVLREYQEAKGEPFAGHRTGDLLRRGLPSEMEAALCDEAAGLRFRGSAGRSSWAGVPWAGAFDPIVTESPTESYYVAYLFHAAEPCVHLSLLQGTVAMRVALGREAPGVLRKRARLMRGKLPDFTDALGVESVELGSPNQLPRDYEAGYAMGSSYDLETLPSEPMLVADLQIAVAAYRALRLRGGLEGMPAAKAGA